MRARATLGHHTGIVQLAPQELRGSRVIFDSPDSEIGKNVLFSIYFHFCSAVSLDYVGFPYPILFYCLLFFFLPTNICSRIS